VDPPSSQKLAPRLITTGWALIKILASLVIYISYILFSYCDWQLIFSAIDDCVNKEIRQENIVTGCVGLGHGLSSAVTVCCRT
jgi:hypothetical protein